MSEANVREVMTVEENVKLNIIHLLLSAGTVETADAVVAKAKPIVEYILATVKVAE